jgi:hypothetical protein
MISATHLNEWATAINNAFNGVTAVTIKNVNNGILTVTAGDGIVAHAGGGQASATLLTASVNRVATVGTAADSVKLPVSVAGMVVQLVNDDAANSMQVFGSGTDTINDVATATGVAQAAGKAATYSCPVAGKWYRNLSA